MGLGRARAAALALALLGTWAALGAGAASASTWKLVDLPDDGVSASLHGISCPTERLCVAVGGNNTIVSSDDPARGGSAWRIVRPGGGFQIPFGEPGPAAISSSSYGGGQIRGVSCPSTGLCVAASFEGDVYSSTNPTGPVAAWKVVPLTAENQPNVHMGGISCPSPSLCVAAAYGGKVAVSTNPTGDQSAWTVVELAVPYDLRGVSCASVSLCVAVGNEGSIVVSTDPTGGPAAWQPVGQPAGEGSMNGVSCPSPALCVTGNAGRIVSSTNPTAASSWKAIAAGSGLPVKGVACPAVSACAAIDNNADVIVSTNPTGGPGAWSFKNLLPYDDPSTTGEVHEGNGMFAISCATTELCATAGQEYRLLVSTDPFAPDVLKGAAGGKSKRPRVVITRHPAKRIETKRGGTPVLFRFRAVGAKARGFRCKLTGGRSRPCSSPKRYKLGPGKRVFKVRAIAAEGRLLGPVETFHFRIGKLTEPPPVGSCPEGTSDPGQPCVNARAERRTGAEALAAQGRWASVVRIESASAWRR